MALAESSLAWRVMGSTLAERIVAELQSGGIPLDDDDLAGRLGVVRQVVNQACRRMEKQGVLARSAVVGGKIANRLVSGDSSVTSASDFASPRSSASRLLTEGRVKADVRGSGAGGEPRRSADIDANLTDFLRMRTPTARYASFDYCYNHFQAARESGDTAALGKGESLLLSCLHLGFYLASWGMMRGSSDLLQRSVRDLVPVVELIAAEPDEVWNLGAGSLITDTELVMALSHRVHEAFAVDASDTLVTKTMLGVFGCVPPFDRFFRIGFGCQTFCREALVRIGAYYQDNRAKIDRQEVRTLDFSTGLETERRYPASKIIDMVFFQEGLNIQRTSAETQRNDAAKS